MIIVEHGKGTDSAANSYTDLESLRFHARYFRFPIPSGESEQIEYLMRAVAAMDGMRWKGERTLSVQPLAWPRSGIVFNGAWVDDRLVPYGIRHGQVMLAIEMYADDQGLEMVEPKYAHDKGRLIPLSRSSAEYRLDPPLWVSSRTQFADYLVMRGLSIVR
ncbi:hypothetical protein FQ192_10425 [Pseudomonas sp. ANT_J12]|uniref:DnaT-like ssDNA-binding protein n=1 Tax=Pseudomonas sp. ANT_J12 TaxID=2597351 RepID=UPI0011F19713|nr:DnaT-like ssDNA-binding protein [Pseudomonas sp. ANT_J12]KAA0995452.1 hypothetical protein FQ192_10425 [Pseudomonas sp. ANT_J12]